MSTEPSLIPGAFQYAGYWFVTDKSFNQLTRAVACPDFDFLGAAVAECRLPDLGEAPVASWLLARVCSMTRGRVPYQFDEVQGSDGNDFHIGFLCHQTDGSVVGSVKFWASASDIRLHAEAVPPVSAERLRDAIKKAVFSSPHRVARSRVTVVWSDGTDDEARRSVPRVYGFDGGRYLDELRSAVCH